MRDRISRLIARYRTPLYIIGAALAIAAVVVLRGGASREELVDEGPTLPLVVSGPERIDAGEPWTLTIEGREGTLATDAEVLDVHVTGPWGIRTMQLAPPDDWIVTVPGELTKRTGVLTATVRVGDAVGSGFVEVVPLEAVNGAIPLAGPRSIIADFDHWTMVSAFPRDKYGNAVADGTPVVVEVRRPDGGFERVETEVEFLLAKMRVFSESLAGRTALRMNTEGATGPEVEVLEVPGPPVDVEVIVPDVPFRADGRMLVNLSTSLLVDQYDNVLIDGTTGVVRMDGPLGVGTLRPFTIEGRFEFFIEAPSIPGTVTLDVEVDGVRSEPVVLEFVSDVSELPVETERTDEGVLVSVGDVLSVHGGYVPDGTRAFLRSGELEIDAEINDGRAELLVRLDPGETIEIEVLGTTVEVEAP